MRDAVSPAYAGIDLSRAPARKSATCLPRVRGDRPCCPASAPLSMPSPPRTRGSTPVPGQDAAHLRVSPAYAGIDPDKDSSAVAVGGLPRVRGDRPAPVAMRSATNRSPPRTRRSTPTGSRRRSGGRVSPAYAGIDPRCAGSRHRGGSLPRVRGDRPRPTARNHRLAESPPRTRGSTRGRRIHSDGKPVSPAYAGIDPGRRNTSRQARSLPRVRGDRPLQSAAEEFEEPHYLAGQADGHPGR